MFKFEVSDAQLQEILTYLSKRPYIEVFALIQSIQSLQPIIEKQPEVTPTEEG